MDPARIEALVAAYSPIEVRATPGKGCAFASFASFAQAERAIQDLNGMAMFEGGEGIHVELADFKGAPKGTGKKPKVFIGGVSKLCSEADVQEFCACFGVVVHNNIYSKSPNSKPCAFVTFSTFTEAERCIDGMNGTTPPKIAEEGRPLNVKWADIQPSGTTTHTPPQFTYAPVVPPPQGREPPQQALVSMAKRPAKFSLEA